MEVAAAQLRMTCIVPEATFLFCAQSKYQNSYYPVLL